MTRLTPAMELILDFTTLQANLLKKIDGEMEVHGISYSEYVVLHQLNTSPNKTLRRIDLAGRVGMSASGVTRMLKPMEKIGLVEKEINPRDARVSLVKLSKGGKKIVSDATSSFKNCAATLTNSLRPEQLVDFIKLTQLMR